jgi:hypothetical protein
MRHPRLRALTIRQIECPTDRSSSRNSRVQSRLILELLEDRCLLSAVRTITGFGSNIAELTSEFPASHADVMSMLSQPMAGTEAIAGGEMGACFLSDGSCEQLTEGTCEAVGGISWLAGAPCPCCASQTTGRQDSTSAVLTENVFGGGQAPPRPDTTAAAFALLARVSNTVTQSNLSVPSTPSVAAPMPIMTITNKGLDALPVAGAVPSVVPVAETESWEAFWQRYGANDRQTLSLELVDSGKPDDLSL